ncbi:MAG: TetR/AcrR family transcriptional regulator [Bacillota bacterium]|nr:TetR/AcrR family transcriptional regulator [Bacillota bacterium]
MTAPVEHQSSKKQLIIDAATRLIMEQGVKGTSLADVAREAKISKGTLFYYFPAKDDLIYELTVQHFDNISYALLDRVESMKEESLYKIMQECVATILMAEDRGRLNLYLLQEAVIENEVLRIRFRQTYQEYRVLMKKFLQIVSPSSSAEDNEVLSTMLIALADGLIIQWLIDPDTVSIDKTSRIMANLRILDSSEI